MSADEPPRSGSPSCVHCVHFFVTWEEPLPKGCRGYGFKSDIEPSLVVLRESGTPCQLYERKEPGRDRKRRREP